MAVTAASLVEAYPEFANADLDAVDAAIARAKLRVDGEVLGAQEDVAVLHLACHELAGSQYGLDLRLAADDGDSFWNKEAQRLLRAAGASWRTLG